MTIFELRDLRMRHLFALAADEDALELGTIVQMFRQPPEPLAIDDRDLRAGIEEPVFDLRPGPPGIERSGDAAGEQAAEEGDRPFRKVAHGDGDAVALADAGLLQRRGDGERGARERLIARALVAIDDERALAVGAAEQKCVAQGRRRVLPDARAHAADGALLDLER